MSNLTEELRGAVACQASLRWIAAYDSFEDAWDGCHRGDWLLWFAHILGVDPQLVVKTAIACARLVADTPRGQNDKRLLDAMFIASSWKPAEIDASHVKKARDMIEQASHRSLLSGPDMSVLQSMVELVRRRIPWPMVEARIEIVDGALVRKID